MKPFALFVFFMAGLLSGKSKNIISWNRVYNDNWQEWMRGYIHNEQHLIDLYNAAGTSLHDLPAFVKAVDDQNLANSPSTQ